MVSELLLLFHNYQLFTTFSEKQLEYPFCTMKYLKLWYVFFFIKFNNIMLKPTKQA